MKDIIFIAGAPGSGKSSVAKELQRALNSPLFEFGWIPEFRDTGDRITSYVEDEEMAYENLALVVNNYIKHGFKNILITDLENKRITQLGKTYEKSDYLIFTLRIKDEDVLKGRVLDEKRSSGYRNWQEAQEINSSLWSRTALNNEVFIDISHESHEDVANSILDRIKSS